MIELRPDWEDEKTKVMEKIIRLKFRKAYLKRMLLLTGDTKLVHLTYWHDTFWGVCACTAHKRTGQNRLGEILMKIRAEMKN